MSFETGLKRPICSSLQRRTRIPSQLGRAVCTSFLWRYIQQELERIGWIKLLLRVFSRLTRFHPYRPLLLECHRHQIAAEVDLKAWVEQDVSVINWALLARHSSALLKRFLRPVPKCSNLCPVSRMELVGACADVRIDL